VTRSAAEGLGEIAKVNKTMQKYGETRLVIDLMISRVDVEKK
jgi:hypothetical protein